MFRNNNLPVEYTCMLPVRTRADQIARERGLDHRKPRGCGLVTACQEVTGTIWDSLDIDYAGPEAVVRNSWEALASDALTKS
jgi:hypothetical protein